MGNFAKNKAKTHDKKLLHAQEELKSDKTPQPTNSSFPQLSQNKSITSSLRLKH